MCWATWANEWEDGEEKMKTGGDKAEAKDDMKEFMEIERRQNSKRKIENAWKTVM